MEVGQSERERMDFILTAIAEYKSSSMYRTAIDAQRYFDGENPTIARYEKLIYDLYGRAHADMWTANHKIASSFFNMAVNQEVSYLLGNGVTFSDSATKEKLETNVYRFDQQIIEAAEDALIGGVSYGFWNLDHIDTFSALEFVPLIDEENGALSAGIRFWQIDGSKPLRATLYEIDGYTDYIRPKGEDMRVMREKRRYTQIVAYSDIDGTVIYDGDNYPTFPIVPLKNNKQSRSELCGKRNTIDALDLASSNMVNNVDEGNLIYWVLSNAGGMDDIDDAKFIERIKTLKVAHTDDGVTAEAHTIEAPFTGTQATIDMLTKRLYDDFQCFDSSAVSAGQQTATAIRASYVPLDLKCDKFETQVTRFINGILSLAGIDDEPSYTRNQIINKSEEAQTVLLGAEYFTRDYITRKLLTILGDADMADEIINEMEEEDLGRFSGSVEQEETAADNVDNTVDNVENEQEDQENIEKLKENE